MRRKRKQTRELPELSALEEALKREKYQRRYGAALRSIIFTLVTVAALAVLVATLWLPVLRIYGTSMSPTLDADDIVVVLKGSNFQRGDVIAFYYNNRLLVKRVIAFGGEIVDIMEDGTVTIDGEALDEPYVLEKCQGDHDIEFPYEVPKTRIFVLGDHRSVSMDSRNSAIGCVAEEQVVGRLAFRFWPFERMGALNRDPS